MKNRCEQLLQLPKILDDRGNLSFIEAQRHIPFKIERPYFGLYVPPGIWAQEQGFSSGSVCLVFASLPYDESDYIRDFDNYKKFVDDHR